MVEYSKVNVKLSDRQLKQLKTAVKKGNRSNSGNEFKNAGWKFQTKKGMTMKIFQALEDSNILLKGVTKTIKNETKEQKGGFLSMLFGTLGASLLGNILSGKGIIRAGSGNKKEKGIVRAGCGKQWDF